MKGQLDLLIRLQEIDTEINLTTQKKSDEPRRLEEAKRPLQLIQEELEQVRGAMETASKTKRDKEGDLQAQEQTIDKLKSRQPEIKTNKEYQALLQELSTAQQIQGKLEEDLLLLMEELDNDAQKVRQEEQRVKKTEDEYRSKEQELTKEARKLDEILPRLQGERDKTARSLEENPLTEYEKIKSKRKNLAVVPIVHGSCGGCHMSLPPQLIAEVKHDKEIHACSYCHRILFFLHPGDGTEAGEDQSPQSERPTSAKNPLPAS